MSGVTGRQPNASSDGATSTIDRVRGRMKRLIHPRDLPPPVPGCLPRDPVLATTPVTASALCPLAADIGTLQEALEDSEKLIRQAWIVAADLNQLRRRCGGCESIGALPESLGTFQGLLNRWRQNLRTAMIATDKIKAAVSSVRGQP